MDINFDTLTPWITLLFGVGVVWLVASVVLKLARTVISIGCSLLVLVAAVVLLMNLF